MKRLPCIAIHQAIKDHTQYKVIREQLLGSAIGQEGNAGTTFSTIEGYHSVLQ